MKKLNLIVVFFCLVFLFSNTLNAQELLYKYEYNMDLNGATEAPKLGGMPRIEVPEEAKKMGVEGIIKAVMTLGADGRVKDYKFPQTLPHGLEDSVINAYKSFSFEPAKQNGTPIDSTLFFNFIITAVYDERDRNVKKVKITDQPDAVYPPDQIAGEHKGEVLVGVLFDKDGSKSVVGVSSTMPKEFDEAAIKAVENIKFEPATHKKSKKPISMKMFVKYKFKP